MNDNYKKGLIYFISNIYKIPYILYDLHKNSKSSKELTLNFALLENLGKAFQISSIMNTSLETVIKKVRLLRNIPMLDRQTGKVFITRQVRHPLVGAEVCPYINYVNKCQFINVEFKYSILVVEDKITHYAYEYKCDIHNSCVIYEDKNSIRKHLEEWDFWKEENYWKNKYPNEKEIVNN